MEKFDYKELDAEGFRTLEVISEADKFNEWMYTTIAPYCTGRILEIGSGIGNISKLFLANKKDVVLSDIRSNYCDFLQKKVGIPDDKLLRNLNLTDPELTLKFSGYLNSFDTVFALNVIEHIEEDDLAIINCSKFLKNGGTLIILVPAFNFLYNTFDKELGHYRRYNKRHLSGLFQKAGLKIKMARYFNAAGILGWLVSGKLQQNKTIPSSQMKFYNNMVPVFKIADKILLNRIGLSVIVVGQKV